MAFSSTTQEDGLRLGNKYMSLFKGTAGATGNTITVNFVVDYIIGLPAGCTFAQSGTTVTITGLTDTHAVNFMLVGAGPA